MIYMLFIIPVMVIMFEYTAISMALVYAKFAVELDRPVVKVLSGAVKVGESIPYDAVPNTVIVLHLLSLVLSVVYLVYFFMFRMSQGHADPQVPPQED